MAANSMNQGAEPKHVSLPVPGRGVLIALGLWLAGSLLIVGVTLGAARLLIPGWAANASESATVIVAEVYVILIVALIVAFGGRRGASSALRLRAVTVRALATALIILALVTIVVDLTYLLAGLGGAIHDAYLRSGTDGGRLGTMGLIMTLLSLVRACVLAPVGEELLLRGAIYGWSRRWLRAWPAIVLNSVVLGGLEGAIGGNLVLLPRLMVSYLTLNWIREHTDSTVPGMAMHITNNTIVVIVVYLLTGWR